MLQLPVLPSELPVLHNPTMMSSTLMSSTMTWCSPGNFARASTMLFGLYQMELNNTSFLCKPPSLRYFIRVVDNGAKVEFWV
jgi:hypothetical protein